MDKQCKCTKMAMAGASERPTSFAVSARRQSKPLWATAALWRTIFISTIALPATNLRKVGLMLVTPLAQRPRTTNNPKNPCDGGILGSDHRRMDRRQVFLQGIFGSMAATALLASEGALAAIDVSGLAVEANPLDVFLGGTYYDDDTVDREGIDGRIARRKYTIVEANGQDTRLIPGSGSNKKKTTFFEGFENRSVKILGESTSISSSRDDGLELNGNLFLCNERKSKGCIVIDFSPLGGPREAKGYWDDIENGIRFADSNTVWSKQ